MMDVGFREHLHNVLQSRECGVVPRDINIYIEALVHRSAADSYGVSQERLEHLGDAVLGLCVTHLLFKKYPTAKEGELSEMRSKLVKGTSLSKVGRRMCIEKIAIVAEGVSLSDRIYEDTTEALIGAIYLDLGLCDAFRFVAYHIENAVSDGMLSDSEDHKSILRRILQSRGMQTPYYSTTDVDGITRTQVYVGDVLLAEADGTSRKRAEMEAARLAVLACST